MNSFWGVYPFLKKTKRVLFNRIITIDLFWLLADIGKIFYLMSKFLLVDSNFKYVF